MTLSDDDKQFIKDTIDYRIKRGSAGKGGSSDTESGKKLSKLEYEEREKKNRDLLLKELKERDKRGENTIAQKVEMLNLSMKQAIPDDFKEAMQQTGANIKKGTSQVGRGLSHLTDRAMMSNPLTAMLWQNRDIAKAAWDVGAGSVRAVAGGISGIGRGAAGLVNNAINMFRRKKKNEEIPEDEAPEFNENKPQEQEEETDEKSMADKINEMHEWIFKHWKKDNEQKNKEQKEQKGILSKGLAGLGKSMKAVNGFVEMIQAKQKLILSAVVLGAVAILGLAAWFKNGGFSDLITGIQKSIIGKTYRKLTGEPEPEEYKPTLGNSINTSILKGEDYSNYLKDNQTNFTSVTGDIPKMAVSTNGEPVIGNAALKEYTYDVGELTPVLAPFDGQVVSIKMLTVNVTGVERSYFQIDLYTDYYVPKGAKEGKPLKIRFDYVINPKVTNEQSKDYNKVKKGQIIGFSDGKLKITDLSKNATGIVNDYGEFINEAAKTNFKDNIDITLKNIENKKGYEQKVNDTIWKTIREKEFNKNLKKDKQDDGGITVGEALKNGLQYRFQQVRSVDDDFVNDNLKEIANTAVPRPTIEDADVNITNITNDNKTDSTLQQQNDTLKNQDKAQKEVKEEIIDNNSPNNSNTQPQNISLSMNNHLPEIPGNFLTPEQQLAAKSGDYRIS